MLLKLGWKLFKNLPRLAVVGAGAGIAYSALGVDHRAPLGPSLPGARLTTTDDSGGSVTLYHDDGGSGTPVLLVHSVHAAASAYEMRPLYTRLQGQRPVWALDLPGFGESQRGPRSYTPELMSSAVESALDTIGRPTHVVALSLGSELAARAAVAHPERIATLSIISPTGFGPRQGGPEVLGRLLNVPVWSQAIFDGLVSRRGIRYFLGKAFAGPVDELAVDHAYNTSHQPGARFAPIAFLTGDLFTPRAVEVLYEPLEVPTLVIYDRDPFTSFARLPEFIADRPGWSATRIAGTNGFPHWDRPTETLTALEDHWGTVDS